MYKVINLLKKYIYIFVALLFFVFITITYYVSSTDTNLEVRQVFNVSELISNCEIKEISEITENYEINIYYPETTYLNLNEKVNNKISEYIESFKQDIKGLNPIDGQKFLLNINFSSYEYEEYFSYAFEIFTDFGGAHPNTTSWTINYNVKDRKIVDINYLIEKNKNILNILSEYTFNELKENEQIKDNYVEEMLKNGTEAKKENFQNFIFTKEGLRIIFQRYSVAPYSSGEFSVTIPYNKLNVL